MQSTILDLIAPALALAKQQYEALQAVYDIALNGYTSDVAAIKVATDAADAATAALADATKALTDNNIALPDTVAAAQSLP